MPRTHAPSRASVRDAIRAALCFIAAIALPACHAPPPLSERRSDAELRATIDAAVQPGASPPQVQSALTELGVKPVDQELTPDPAGPRLKAWVWGPSGAWAPSDPDDYFDWAALLFRFDAVEHLEGYDIERHSVMVRSLMYKINVRRDPQVRPRPKPQN